MQRLHSGCSGTCTDKDQRKHIQSIYSHRLSNQSDCISSKVACQIVEFRRDYNHNNTSTHGYDWTWLYMYLPIGSAWAAIVSELSTSNFGVGIIPLTDAYWRPLVLHYWAVDLYQSFSILAIDTDNSYLPISQCYIQQEECSVVLQWVYLWPALQNHLTRLAKYPPLGENLAY